MNSKLNLVNGALIGVLLAAAVSVHAGHGEAAQYTTLAKAVGTLLP